MPTALRRAADNPGKRGYNHAGPVPPDDLPDCPEHLSEVAREDARPTLMAISDEACRPSWDGTLPLRGVIPDQV